MNREEFIKRSEIIQAEIAVITRIAANATSMDDLLSAISEEQKRNVRDMQRLKEDAAEFLSDPNKLHYDDLIPIEECLSYFQNSPLYTSERYYTFRHFKIAQLHTLPNWGEAFNRYLRKTGTAKKKQKDWITHFNNWLKHQTLESDPNKLNILKSNDNDQQPSN